MKAPRKLAKISLEVYDALSERKNSAAESFDAVLRRLLDLSPLRPPPRPVPPRKNTIYPRFELLAVGEAAVVPWRVDEKGCRLPNQQAIYNAVRRSETKHGVTFSSAPEAAGVRVTRLR